MSTDAHRHGQKITRRGFLLASVAAAAAGGGAALTGYLRRGDGRSQGADVSTALRPATSRGGTLRAFNFDATLEDTLDPHLTQMGPVVEMHSAVFSKLLQYDDEQSGTIVPDLCDGMPEQPDESTYVIRLRDGVRFHDTPAFRLAHPSAAGRTLVADDVKYSIERQIDSGSPQRKRFFRASNWSSIDRVEVNDARTLTVRMKQPLAPFLALLAGRHSFIIPREVVDSRDEAKRDLDMLGTGPFLLDAWQPGIAVKLRRNPRWFAADDHADGSGGRRPFLDAYEAHYSPQQDVFQQVVFDHMRIDTTEFTDVNALDRERQSNLSDIVLEQRDTGGILASRLLLDRPPFKDDRVRSALNLAIDRPALASALYPPLAGETSARLSGPIAPSSPWALASDELLKRPGYRSGAQRDDDVRTAKQLWSAALGDAPVELRITLAAAPGALLLQAANVLRQQLEDALGARVTPAVDPSGYGLTAAGLLRNLDGASDGVVPFTFGFEDGGVDLDEWVYPGFRSGQPQNTYRLEDATLDTMLDAQRREFNTDARRRQGLAIQSYLLANVNARLEYLAPVARRVTWGYVRNSFMPWWYGSAYKLADTWLDTSHALWASRPA